MKTFKKIRLTTENGIACLTIDRPEAMNALNREVIGEISEAVETIRCSGESDVLIFTGAGKSFVAGADIACMSDMDTIAFRAFTRFGQDVMNRIEKLEIPTIAAVNGFALGGGCELAMACDIRIASEKAKFGQPEVQLGIIPGFGGTQRLPRLVGDGTAKHLIFTGEVIDAAEAYRIGLVQKVLPLEGFMDGVMAYAQTIRDKAPIAVSMAKSAMVGGASFDTVSGVAFEAEASAVAFSTQDRVEGMRAFLEKREPVFRKK
ncbi:MAG: enoyl-CoA hydratase/isomerase family protein [Clostridiales Family XIII bacterium]|jgi:enoyl-CoA hydratase|nr:enoyl-CoA hydratase/isomerase family protein [Clostridiales Family XIII bacterium]